MESKRLKIVFLISHKPDIRYIKRFHLLANQFDLFVIYWNKSTMENVFSYPGIEIKEIHILANQTNPIRRIPQTLKFSKVSYKELKKTNADIVYAGNLDMLMVAIKYAKRNKKTKVIYEIADLHRLIVDKQKGLFNKLLSSFLKRKEKKLCTRIDLLVLTSMKFFDVYYKHLVDKDKVVFMPNVPEWIDFDGFEKKEHDGFVVAFIGSVRYKRQLSMLIDAAEKCGVKVLIAGKDAEGDSFKNRYLNNDCVEFFGEFDYKKQIKDIYSVVDCIYAVYDADMFNVRVALPNKLYESAITEIPIIVSKNTYLFELVESMDIGFGVSHKDVEDLVQTIDLIKFKGEKYREKCASCHAAKIKLTSIDYGNVFLQKINDLKLG